MKICGLQKLTLLDYPGKTACTVFTGGCNFRCPFCHNASLVQGDCEPEETEDEFFAFLKKRKNVLDGVCVTGGEPLLHPGIMDFLQKIRDLGYSVKLDTNGSLTDTLKAIVEKGLVDYVAMDVKNSPALYAKSVGLSVFDYSAVGESIDFLLTEPVDYEFRTTVVKGLHNEKSLEGAARSIRGAKRYFLQKFVDSGNVLQDGYSAFSDSEMKTFLKIVSPFVQSAALRGV